MKADMKIVSANADDCGSFLDKLIARTLVEHVNNSANNVVND